MSLSLKLILLLLSLLSFALPLSGQDLDKQEMLNLLTQAQSDLVATYDGTFSWSLFWNFYNIPKQASLHIINFVSFPDPHSIEFWDHKKEAFGFFMLNGFYPEQLVSTLPEPPKKELSIFRKKIASTFPELPDKRFSLEGHFAMIETGGEHKLTFHYGGNNEFVLFNANKAIELLIKNGFKKTTNNPSEVKFDPEQIIDNNIFEFPVYLEDKKCFITCEACSKSLAIEAHVRDAIKFFAQNNLSAKLTIKPEIEEDCRLERNSSLKIKDYFDELEDSLYQWTSKRFLGIKFPSPVDLRAGGKPTDLVVLTSVLFGTKKKGKLVFLVRNKETREIFKIVDFKFIRDLPALLKQRKLIVLAPPSEVAKNQKFKLGKKTLQVPLPLKVLAKGALKSIKSIFGIKGKKQQATAETETETKAAREAAAFPGEQLDDEEFVEFFRSAKPGIKDAPKHG